MRRRPEVPADMFFDDPPAPEPAAAAPAKSAKPPRIRQYKSLTAKGDDVKTAPRVGRPPAQKGPKVAVTLYLTEPVAYLLEQARFTLLTEHGLRTTKSALADFALRTGLQDLAAAAEDLRPE